MAYQHRMAGALSTEQPQPTPRLRPKPSTNKLRSQATQSTVLPTSNLLKPPVFNRSRTDLAVPRTTNPNNAPIDHNDTSIYTRKVRKPSGLPTPAERSTTPIARPRTGPPTKDHRVFSDKSYQSPSSGGSSGTNSDKGSGTEQKRERRVLKKIPSASGSERAYTATRKNSMTSYGSTTSLSTSGSSHFGSRNTSQTSVLGITAPATSSSSQTSLLPPSAHQRSASTPRVITQGLQVSSIYDSLTATTDNSSPTTRYTDSPFSHTTTPTSAASSVSPGPSAMLRAFSSSPRVTSKNRSGSTSSIDYTLKSGPVRESTTSTSSDATIRPHYRSKSTSNPKLSTTPKPLPSKSPKLAPSPALGSRRPTPTGIPARPTAGLGIIPSSLSRTRSKSTGSSLPTVKSTATAPSPSIPSTVHASRSIPKSIAKGLTYSSTPPLGNRRESKELPSLPLTTPVLVKPSFFMKQRTKSEDKLMLSEKVSTGLPATAPTVRRGPAAGTGYEGFGNFGKASRARSGSNGSIRGRSGSTSSTSAPRDRSRSGSRSGSRASVEMDDYFVERLKPVVILGGAVIENHNIRSADMVRSGSSPATFDNKLGVFSRGASPADNDKETVASRRARSPGRAMTPIPPINTTGYRIRPAPSPASSIESTRKSSVDDKIPKKNRWNIFQKSAPKVSSPPPAAPTTATPPPIVPQRRLQRPAHYALIDEDQQREARDLVEAMRQRRAVSNETPKSTPPANSYTHNLRKQQSSILKSTPTTSTTISKIAVIPSQFQNPVQRHKEILRLASLARSQENLAAAPKSAPLAVKPVQRVDTPLSAGASVSERSKVPPPLGRLIVPPPAPQEEFQVNWDSYGLTPTAATSEEAGNRLPLVKDFLEYDPLDLRGRRFAAPTTPMEGHTPISVNSPYDQEWPIRKESGSEPKVERRVTMFDGFGEHEEEFYNEMEGLYGITTRPVTPDTPNDISEVPELPMAAFAAQLAGGLKRSDTMASTTSSMGSPFQYADFCSPTTFTFDLPKSPETEKSPQPEEWNEDRGPDSPTIPAAMPMRILPYSIPTLTETSASPYIGIAPTTPLPFTPPAQSVLSPTTPFSITSFIRYYGDRKESNASNVSALDRDRKFSDASNRDRKASDASFFQPMHQLDSPDLGRKQHKSTSSTDTTTSTRSRIAAEEEIKIRPWALLASRWLSFDRVLVSPADQVLRSGGRVLVVDGLGTDDWSFYCALSYPAAKVYNLTSSPPRPSLPSPGFHSPGFPPNSPLPSPGMRPANHHQISHPSLSTSFPFPKSFFNAVILRFPPPAENWTFIITECKRVLQPGGYLEVTLLDRELRDSGNRANRAVSLVTEIMARERGGRFEGGSESEKMIRLIRKKGLVDGGRCFLGLKAVGEKEVVSPASAYFPASLVGPSNQAERNSNQPDLKEIISKVGRWWYSRCYEGVITGDGQHMGRSMWMDRKLLAECQRNGTGFRMLVCCARKPEKRRPSNDAREDRI